MTSFYPKYSRRRHHFRKATRTIHQPLYMLLRGVTDPFCAVHAYSADSNYHTDRTLCTIIQLLINLVKSTTPPAQNADREGWALPNTPTMESPIRSLQCPVDSLGRGWKSTKFLKSRWRDRPALFHKWSILKLLTYFTYRSPSRLLAPISVCPWPLLERSTN